VLAADAPKSISFQVNQFVIEGELPISSKKVDSLLTPLEGKEYGLADLQSVTKQVEKLIRDAGFAFYRVVLPPQK